MGLYQFGPAAKGTLCTARCILVPLNLFFLECRDGNCQTKLENVAELRSHIQQEQQHLGTCTTLTEPLSSLPFHIIAAPLPGRLQRQDPPKQLDSFILECSARRSALSASTTGGVVICTLPQQSTHRSTRTRVISTIFSLPRHSASAPPELIPRLVGRS